MTGPQAHWLPDGRRLHLNHGPIDLIVEADGTEPERRAAFSQGVARFSTVLGELVGDLAALRSAAGPRARRLEGTTARRMEAAVVPLAAAFITPMAAVAGAVADEVLAAMLSGRSLARAYVNNGGDIALHLSGNAGFSLAIAGTGLDARIALGAADAARGIATSGWRGRSHSLGIADAVTVLAADAAAADAAATLIANAVDLPGHAAIERCPARAVDPDSDLGDRLVTRAVGPLGDGDIDWALDAGLAVAASMRQAGHILGAALFLGRRWRLCGATGNLAVARNREAA